MIWEREDGSCFAKIGSKFDLEHLHIVWNNGKDEENGTLLFLSLVVGVWGLESGQRFVKSTLGTTTNCDLSHCTFHPIFIILPKTHYSGLDHNYSELDCGLSHMATCPNIFHPTTFDIMVACWFNRLYGWFVHVQMWFIAMLPHA